VNPEEITYFFENDILAGDRKFRLEAENRVGNKSVFEYVLKRK
jgi:hypothetical protein